MVATLALGAATLSHCAPPPASSAAPNDAPATRRVTNHSVFASSEAARRSPSAELHLRRPADGVVRRARPDNRRDQRQLTGCERTRPRHCLGWQRRLVHRRPRTDHQQSYRLEFQCQRNCLRARRQPERPRRQRRLPHRERRVHSGYAGWALTWLSIAANPLAVIGSSLQASAASPAQAPARPSRSLSRW